MARKDILPILIASLSGQEKRHIALMLSRYKRGRKNQILQLFNACSKRAALKAGDTAYLPQQKQYLFSVIMKALRHYHAGSSIDMEIRELLQDAEIALGKSLYNLVYRSLKKAMQLCIRFERLSHIPEIRRLESFLFVYERNEKAFNSEKMALKQLLNISEYRQLSNRLAHFISQSHTLRKEPDLIQLSRLTRSPLTRNEGMALSITAKNYFHYIRSTVADLTGNKKAALLHRESIVNLFRENQALIPTQLKNYLSALNNLAISQVDAHAPHKAIETIAEIRDIAGKKQNQKSADIQVNCFLFASINELNLHNRTGEPMPLAHLTAIESGVKKFGEKISGQFRIPLVNSLKNHYFMISDFKKARYWSGYMLLKETSLSRQDIQSMNRIFDLVLHFETGNRDYLESAIRSTYRFLMKREHLFRFEKIILNYLKKSSWLFGTRELINSFKGLIVALKPLLRDRYERQVFEEFDIIAWLESKVHGKSFPEIIRRKYNLAK